MVCIMSPLRARINPFPRPGGARLMTHDCKDGLENDGSSVYCGHCGAYYGPVDTFDEDEPLVAIKLPAPKEGA